MKELPSCDADLLDSSESQVWAVVRDGGHGRRTMQLVRRASGEIWNRGKLGIITTCSCRRLRQPRELIPVKQRTKTAT